MKQKVYKVGCGWEYIQDPNEIATLFDGAIVYAKGARLMLMLIRLMGWDNFCKGITDYFKKFAYKNTVGDDLWDSLSPYAEFEPKELMHAFIDKPGYPVITNLEGNFEKFSQQRFLLDGPCVDDEWPLPEVSEDMSGHYVLNLTGDEFENSMHDNSRTTIAGYDTDAYMLMITRDKRRNTERVLAVCASFLRGNGRVYLSSFAKTTREAVTGI